MKNLVIALLLFLTVSSCLPKKKSDVEPDLSGNYQVSQIVSGSQTLNLPDGKGTSAVVVVNRLGDTQIDVTVRSTENGISSSDSYGALTIRKASGRDYDMLNPNTNARIGLINGADFVLDFTSNGTRYALIAKK